MLNKFTILFSGMIFFLFPWYYNDSGRPQPVDVFILSLFIIFFLLRFRSLPTLFKVSKVYKIFIFFTLYTWVVLLINYIVNTDPDSLNLLI